MNRVTDQVSLVSLLQSTLVIKVYDVSPNISISVSYTRTRIVLFPNEEINCTYVTDLRFVQDPLPQLSETLDYSFLWFNPPLEVPHTTHVGLVFKVVEVTEGKWHNTRNVYV